jgi:hypothetical protein
MTLNWRDSREEYRWIVALTGMTVLALLVAGWASYRVGLPPYLIFFRYFEAVFRKAQYAVGIAGGLIVVRALYLRTVNPFRGLWAIVRSHIRSPALAIAGVAPILLVPVLMASFGTLKMLMPLVRDFTWDDSLAAADRLLFFGYQPWQFTHSLFGSPFLTDLIDTAYTDWVLALYTAVLGYALFAPRYERARFFLSFAASWLLIGVVGSYAFASAGPCYAQLVGTLSAPEFAPLMAKLKAIHEGDYLLNAYYWQEVLWRHHSRHEYGFAMGISAMPSMHNAIAVLYALTTSRMARFIKVAAWSYAALIFIGSIHLGWHYAIDGIGAGLMVWGIWAAAGRYLDRVGYTAAIRPRAAEQEPEAELPDFAPEPVAI